MWSTTGIRLFPSSTLPTSTLAHDIWLTVARRSASSRHPSRTSWTARTQTSPLIAANGSHIATFGTREICLDLGFWRTSWSFRLANVTKLILGLDFLSAKHLAVNFQQRTLYATSPYAGGATERDINGNCAVLHVGTPDHNQWSSILSEFPTITTSDFCSPNTKHGISHHIPTTGPPPHVRARRLPPDRLADAKKAFEDMVAEGICRRSSSPYAAPLHMVRKPDGLSVTQCCYNQPPLPRPSYPGFQCQPGRVHCLLQDRPTMWAPVTKHK